MLPAASQVRQQPQALKALAVNDEATMRQATRSLLLAIGAKEPSSMPSHNKPECDPGLSEIVLLN